MKDALATHQRLVGGGFSETQAKACLRLIIDAESGRFDRQAVHELMASANLDQPQTAVLIAELLRRLARQVSGGTP